MTQSPGVSDSPSTTSTTVLLVGAAQEAGKSVRSTAEAEGYTFTVETAASAQEAKAAVANNSVDCIVTTASLPDGDGFDLVKAIRSVEPSVPVVFYVHSGDEALAANAFQHGVDGYVRAVEDGPSVLLETVAGVIPVSQSKTAIADDVDEFALLHTVATILGRKAPVAERLESVAYALADELMDRRHTVVRIQIDETTIETGWSATTTVEYSTGITTIDGTSIRIEIGQVGDAPSALPEHKKPLIDAVLGLIETQVEAGNEDGITVQQSDLVQSMLDRTSIVLSIKDQSGEYELVNGSFEEVYGIDSAEMTGRTDWELFPAKTAQRLRDGDQQVLEHGKTIEAQRTIEVQGEKRPFLIIKAPLLDEDNEPQGVLTVASDLTEHSRLLFEREQILDRMTDAFLAVDGDWRFTFINQVATELLDQPEDTLLGRTLWDVFPEAIGSEFEQQYRYAMAEQETVEFESYFEPLGVRLSITAYPSDSGLSIFARDVTKQRETEKELEQSVEALHRLYKIASHPDASFEEKINRVVSLGSDRLGLPYGFLTRITGDRQHIITSTGDHELLQPGETCALEESYCRKTIETDGLLTVHDAVEDEWSDDRAYDLFELGSYVGGKVVVDGSLYGTLCFAASEARQTSFSDSERAFVELASRWASYELEQRQYRQQLEQQNDRLDKFASTVSHDLRNPLTVARGYIENCSDRHPEDEDIEEALVSLDRAFTIIEDVLAFARLGETVVEREVVGLKAVAEDAWEHVDVGAVTLVFGEDLCQMNCDPDRVQQLFENLFRNAVEHGAEDGRVTVGALENGFYVEDDGPGFGDTDHDRLFEFGYTTADDGTGFGLAIVAEIVDAHGWSIEAVEGETGARFEITGVEDVHTPTDPF